MRLPFGPRPLLTSEEKYGCSAPGFAEAATRAVTQVLFNAARLPVG